MAKDTPEFTQDETLVLSNMVGQGKKLADAKKLVLAARKGSTTKEEPQKPKPQTADEKKAVITAQIVELGGDAPDAGLSVAKHEEALEAAKKAAEDATKDLM